MSSDQNKKNLMELLDGLGSGRLMEVFDKFYADDVVMMENNEPDPNRVGKAKNRAYEQYFADNAQWHGAKLGPVLADGEFTAYEMWMDLTFMGQRMQRTQFAVQTWKDGKIVKEVFYYKG
ncbi:MAG: nuclear transport factor 2 family protein [Myxococcota bacterium]